MSKFRVEFDGSFTNESDAVSFLNLLQECKDKLYAGSGSEQIAIISTCRYHECFHDETPPKPCGNYVNYDLKSVPKVAIATKAGAVVEATEIIAVKVQEKIDAAVAAVDVKPEGDVKP